MAALIVTLSLAGCSLGGGNGSVVPVEDGFDGMVTDVVRIDVPGGFVPLAVGPDGAVAGVGLVSRGPFRDPTHDFIVVEPGGGSTVIVAGLDDGSWPATVALSETTVAWITSNDTDEGIGIEYEHRLFVSPRIQPQAHEMTQEVLEAGGSLGVTPREFHVVGDTVIGAGYEQLTRDVPIFALSADGAVRFLLLEDAVGLGGMDGCGPADSIRFLNWGTDKSGDFTPWEVVFTTVPAEGPLTSERLDLRHPSISSSHRYLGSAACGDAVWYTTVSDDPRYLAWRSVSDPTLSEAYPLPIPRADVIWTSPGYVVGSQVTGASFVMEASTGRSVTNPTNHYWCSTVDVSGEFILWRDGSEDLGQFDAMAAWKCPTFVGRFAPVDG